MKRDTRKIELVETNNIAVSLCRLGGAPYDNGRWKRALYHAVCMSDIASDWETKQKIREALKLP